MNDKLRFSCHFYDKGKNGEGGFTYSLESCPNCIDNVKYGIFSRTYPCSEKCYINKEDIESIKDKHLKNMNKEIKEYIENKLS